MIDVDDSREQEGRDKDFKEGASKQVERVAVIRMTEFVC